MTTKHLGKKGFFIKAESKGYWLCYRPTDEELKNLIHEGSDFVSCIRISHATYEQLRKEWEKNNDK